MPYSRIAFFFLVFLASCSPVSLEDLRLEGESETRKFAMELRGIETKEDLYRALPRIKKRFNLMADLLIKSHQMKEQKLGKKEFREPSYASDELFAELARLYEIPGCRELIETAQAEAVRRLDKQFY